MPVQEAIPIYKNAEKEETFYVPSFEIKLKGRKLEQRVLNDVIQVTYRDNVDEIDSFDLLINNWDADQRDFKYLGFPDELNPGSKRNPDYAHLFDPDPDKEVEIFMGYRENLRLMLTGQITALDPDFPASGAPTLRVRGLNVLHSFRNKKHTWAWYEKRDSEIAEEIGSKPVSDERPGIKFEIHAPNKDNEKVEKFVFMDNQYDIPFLLERARRHGYSLYLEMDQKTGKRKLFFGLSEKPRDVVYELIWGQSLVEFHPRLTTANQVSKVTVRGWDRRKRRPIEKTATWGERGLKINRDWQAIILAIQGRHEVVTDRPIHSPEEAEALAKDILLRQLKEMITASGSTVGLPDLRAGRKVHIKHLGQGFSGEYFITGTTHTIGDSGYRTTFNARREGGLEENR